ncbi:uncharacterized protein LOC116261699 isoform X2 [Nymphaea colorata]|uniref:uncharacterized protein LOC116261699 isoform X2 n=1 Tax=Nymphaea colorata TaxID=210225 RepID=UPI00129E3A10|nr:uncharacterized protein LOC116261699 isoform X2 [Nymphaea colorata]
MPRTDPAWKHCVEEDPDDKEKRGNLRCNYCKDIFRGGVARMKEHLAGTRKGARPCNDAPQEVVQFFVKYLQSKKSGKEQKKANLEFAKNEGLSKGLAGFEQPSYHEMRTWILKEEIDRTQIMLEDKKKTWSKTGCSIMVDGWTDDKSKNLTNFLVDNPSGTFFLKSCAISGEKRTTDDLVKLFMEVIKEVGEHNVVQVITDNDVSYKAACLKLKDIEGFQHIFWTPCAARCLDLMLEDISQTRLHKQVLKKAKAITTFIYGYAWTLNLMRKYTDGKELLRPAVTRFASSYLTLQRIGMNERALRNMFLSREFQDSDYYVKNRKGKRVTRIVTEDRWFWKAIAHIMKITLPIVKVLRIVDSDDKPVMGFLYDHMRKAKEEIASNVNNESKAYTQIWEIIDNRWDSQMHHCLHAAGYFLNPHFHYEDDSIKDRKLKVGFLECLEKMVPNMEERCNIMVQLDAYENAVGLFGRPIAIGTRKRLHPAYWWNTFGDETKELKNFAMRILNLTCSASGCERNWSTFSMVHTKKRNRLEQERLNALVFVMYNLKLKERDTRRKSMGDPLCLDNIDSDDEWIVEKEDPVFPPSSLEDSWLDLTFNVDDINIAPFGVSPRSTQKRKRDSSSKKMQVDKGKRKQGDSENENVDDEKIGEEDESIKYMDDSNEDELSTSDEHNIDEHII